MTPTTEAPPLHPAARLIPGPRRPRPVASAAPARRRRPAALPLADALQSAAALQAVPAAGEVLPRPRPTPHSRRRAQLRRAEDRLRVHAADLGLCLLALLCVVFVAASLHS